MTKPRLPAKLSSRRAVGAWPRAQLFAQLDQNADRPLLWVQGPAGAGKTTLVSSWLGQDRTPVLWYRVDGADVDAATFFSYMSLGATGLSRKRRLVLPVLTPEYLLDVPGFARRYFRLLFDALPARCAVVLDAYENAPGDALHQLVLWALEQLHPEQHLIVTSREAVPSQLAHLATKGLLATLGWPELQLTMSEAETQATAQGLPAASGRSLQARCDGWMAGFVLLLEHARRSGSTLLPAPEPVQGQLFPYYMAELFGQVDAITRELAMRSALMPAFTAAQIQALMPEADAERLLHSLHRRHFFIERSADSEPVYRYHALFKEFLLSQFRLSRAPEDLARWQAQAAEQLRNQGQGEAAVALFTEASCWPQAIGLLCQLAPTWLAQGRNLSLLQAVGRLPEEEAVAVAWLQQWTGLATLPMDPARARGALELAFRGFDATGDEVGTLLSCAAILDSFFLELDDLRPLVHWGGVMHRLLERVGSGVPPEVEIRALAATNVLHALGPLHADLIEHSLHRVHELLPQISDLPLIVTAAMHVSMSSIHRGDWSRTRELVARLGDWLPVAEMPPLAQLFWHTSQVCIEVFSGGFDNARSAVDRMDAVATDNNIRVLDVMKYSFRAYIAGMANDADAIQQEVQHLRESIHLGRRMAASQADMHAAILALSRGNAVGAATLLRSSMETTDALGGHLFTMHCRVLLAMALLEMQQPAAARFELDQVVSFGRAGRIKWLEYTADLLDAWMDWREGRHAQAVATLRRALAFGRAEGMPVPFPWVPVRLLQDLGSAALAAGIEVEHVRHTLRARRVPPPAGAPEHWPWLVKVRCFGRSGVWIDDAPLQLPAKAPKKPLELLRALTAFGDVALAVIENALWPDLDGAAAHNACNVALHRLRRLLGDDGAVLLREGRLALHPDKVWTDVAAFEHVADDGSAAPAHRIERLFSLYRGHFLADDAAAWSHVPRERLRSRLLRTCTMLGQQLGGQGLWEEVALLHRRVIEIDAVAEIAHRGLMHALLQLGRDAEAKAAYAHCVNALRQGLGTQPSQATRDLLKAIRG